MCAQCSNVCHPCMVLSIKSTECKDSLTQTVKSTVCGQPVTVIKGLFTWRDEDPRRWNNFMLGLHVEILASELSK